MRNLVRKEPCATQRPRILTCHLVGGFPDLLKLDGPVDVDPSLPLNIKLMFGSVRNCERDCTSSPPRFSCMHVDAFVATLAPSVVVHVFSLCTPYVTRIQ